MEVLRVAWCLYVLSVSKVNCVQRSHGTGLDFILQLMYLAADLQFYSGKILNV